MIKKETDQIECIKLLLVDDEEGYVNVLSKRLARSNICVTSALKVSDAIHILRDNETGGFRWIDFDFNYVHRESVFGYDLFGLGTILLYVSGCGGATGSGSDSGSGTSGSGNVSGRGQ